MGNTFNHFDKEFKGLFTHLTLPTTPSKDIAFIDVPLLPAPLIWDKISKRQRIYRLKTMFKNWTFDDWMNHILFVVTILLLLYSFIFV